jgi:PKD repeat protein
MWLPSEATTIDKFDNGSSVAQIEFGPGRQNPDKESTVTLPRKAVVTSAGLDVEGKQTGYGGAGWHPYDFKDSKNNSAWWGMGNWETVTPPNDLDYFKQNNFTDSKYKSLRNEDGALAFTSSLDPYDIHPFQMYRFNIKEDHRAIDDLTIHWVGTTMELPGFGGGGHSGPQGDAELLIYDHEAKKWTVLGGQTYWTVHLESINYTFNYPNGKFFDTNNSLWLLTTTYTYISEWVLCVDYIGLTADILINTGIGPEDPVLDIGADGSTEWSSAGLFMNKVGLTGPDLAFGFQRALDAAPEDVENVTIPLSFSVKCWGVLMLSNLKVDYDIMDPNLTATPTNGSIGLNVTFDASQSGENISEYQFDYGDGNLSAWVGTPSTNHTYPDDGLFKARVRVRHPVPWSAEPLESGWSENITITINNTPPNATATFYPKAPFTLMAVTFDSTGSFDDQGIVGWTWDLGDGSMLDGAKVVHTYRAPRIYTVRLKVVDTDGLWNNTTLLVPVGNRIPVITELISKGAGNISTTFSFLANASDLDGTIVYYRWDFGDGHKKEVNNSSGSGISHKYDVSGTFMVTLKVVDDSGNESLPASCLVVVRNTPPIARIKVTSQNPATKDTLRFSAEGSMDPDGKIGSYLWDWGDGNSHLGDSTGATTTYAYQDDGTYTVRLTVTDNLGATNLTSLIVEVSNRAPVATAFATSMVNVSEPIYLVALGSTDIDGNITDYSWKISNGASIIQLKGGMQVVRLSSAGNYTVELTVTDDNGATSTWTAKVQVRPAKQVPPVVVVKWKTKAEAPGWLLGAIVAAIAAVIAMALALGLVLARKGRGPDAARSGPKGVDGSPPEDDIEMSEETMIMDDKPDPMPRAAKGRRGR